MKSLTGHLSPLRYLLLLPVVALGVASILATTTPNLTAPNGSNTQDDGTYDFSFVINHGGTLQTYVLPRYFIVTNGVISSSAGDLSGSVLDNFNNVRFTGPCPVGNTGGAVFTGILNLRNPKGGQGSWVCNNGGASLSWRAYNGG